MGHYMTDAEIRRRYRDMHPGYKRIQILADLNGCSKNEIEQVLKEGKVDMNKDMAMELYQKGLNDREIGEKLGRHGSSVALWRKKNNLPAIGNKPKDVKKEVKLAEKNSEAGPKVNPDFKKGLHDPVFKIEIPEKSQADIVCTKYPPIAVMGQEDKKPVIEEPSAEEFLEEIERLKNENLVLRAILYGAGFDLKEFWQSEEERHGKAN